MSWQPGDRVIWNPMGTDYTRGTVGTIVGASRTQGQDWSAGYAAPPEPYYIVTLAVPVTLPERPRDRIRAHRVTELRVLGSALAPCHGTEA